ncbi:hypothetical protein BDV27DRAFT_128622 [Aspergillus caelatus]|uniref:Uncharacterized protein n=1 Tax=Aspergillus caelatus TaxID=61420 RepID=A0A5N7A368_9EURO|nr:uncharacterized protein BDV27DRAFT_128622 [Aspergillus caelatus]KAE8364317.1 hypothetical protein BDV27DRAFT_128622 [Aspergillus caelatus]
MVLCINRAISVTAVFVVAACPSLSRYPLVASHLKLIFISPSSRHTRQTAAV